MKVTTRGLYTAYKHLGMALKILEDSHEQGLAAEVFTTRMNISKRMDRLAAAARMRKKKK